MIRKEKIKIYKFKADKETAIAIIKDEKVITKMSKSFISAYEILEDKSIEAVKAKAEAKVEQYKKEKPVEEKKDEEKIIEKGKG